MIQPALRSTYWTADDCDRLLLDYYCTITPGECPCPHSPPPQPPAYDMWEALNATFEEPLWLEDAFRDVCRDNISDELRSSKNKVFKPLVPHSAEEGAAPSLLRKGGGTPQPYLSVTPQPHLQGTAVAEKPAGVGSPDLLHFSRRRVRRAHFIKGTYFLQFLTIPHFPPFPPISLPFPPFQPSALAEKSANVGQSRDSHFPSRPVRPATFIKGT